MRVIQVSTYDGEQGAARAARLHRALRDRVSTAPCAWLTPAAVTPGAPAQAPSGHGVVAKHLQLVAQQTACSANPVTHSVRTASGTSSMPKGPIAALAPR